MSESWPPTEITRIAFYPDWGNRWSLWSTVGSLRPGKVDLSPDLTLRLRAWTLVWQVDLDPVEIVKWADPEQGRAWIREGQAIVSALRAELGETVEVFPKFEVFSPDHPSD